MDCYTLKTTLAPVSAHRPRVLIYTCGQLPRDIQSIDDAWKVSRWINHYHPFACAIHDTQQSTTLLVRDHLGIEPLYYTYSDQQLIVAQTIPNILQCLPTRPQYNQSYLAKMRTGWMAYSDETIYQGIYRVEPGTMVLIKPKGMMTKKIYWALEPDGQTLSYHDARDYVAHFSSLMDEALLNAVGKHSSHCASEFSAGLDSSALYCTAKHLGITPSLFMHQAPHDSKFASKYNHTYEQAFLEHYHITDLKRVVAEDFDAMAIFQDYATWFAGPAPYIFFMFAHPLHRAVADGKYPILLSGFGGDQCVSGQIPQNFYIPQLIRQRHYRRAWEALSTEQPHFRLFSRPKQLLRFAAMAHPWLYNAFILERKMRWRLGLLPQPVHPYRLQRYRSVREAEWSLLQGPDSHEVRMRVEYSSIVAKKMGFSYRYPLLYPKLLEFMLSLPLEQKRGEGQGRYLMRRYLEHKLGKPIFQAYRKPEGLDIVPSTLHLFQEKYYQGEYDTYLNTVGMKSGDSFFIMLDQIHELMLSFAS